MARYHSQRASAGLISTEGTHPSPMGRGSTYPPGLHTDEQAAGWRKGTDAVHAAGGCIAVQLMHAGWVRGRPLARRADCADLGTVPDDLQPGDVLPPLRINPERPGRFEPRVRKRRPKQFALMKKPRAQLRKALKRQKLVA